MNRKDFLKIFGIAPLATTVPNTPTLSEVPTREFIPRGESGLTWVYVTSNEPFTITNIDWIYKQHNFNFEWEEEYYYTNSNYSPSIGGLVYENPYAIDKLESHYVDPDEHFTYVEYWSEHFPITSPIYIQKIAVPLTFNTERDVSIVNIRCISGVWGEVYREIPINFRNHIPPYAIVTLSSDLDSTIHLKKNRYGDFEGVWWYSEGVVE